MQSPSSVSLPFTRRYPPGVSRTAAGLYRCRLRLGRFDEVNLGEHGTATEAGRVAGQFLSLRLSGSTSQQAVQALQVVQVVPTDTLPCWVYPVVRRGDVRYRGRAKERVIGVRVTTGAAYCDPWKAHEMVRRALVVAVREATVRSRDRPAASRYPGVRRNARGRSWQARYWLDSRHVNLGVFADAAWGGKDAAERAAGRAWEQFHRVIEVGGEPQAVWERLRAAGVIPVGCVKTYVGG